MAVWTACLLAGCATTVTIPPQPPRVIAAALSASACEPGHAVKITLTADRPELLVHCEGLDQNVRLSSLAAQPELYEGFVAVPLDAASRRETLVVTVADSAAATQTSLALEILPRSSYRTVRLHIAGMGRYHFSPESLKMSAARRKAEYLPEVAWKEPWGWPVHGRITEGFGVKRIYNNGLHSWYHAGLDIAAPGGTEILAPAAGEVILAEHFQAHGNTVLIDHGFGVVTTYLHQQEFLVEPGEFVQAGQPIGKVGSTGSSTGNHLHFQVNVNGIMVDPFDFIRPKLNP